MDELAKKSEFGGAGVEAEARCEICQAAYTRRKRQRVATRARRRILLLKQIMKQLDAQTLPAVHQ